MIDVQQGISKLRLFAVGTTLLFALSACSNDNSTNSDATDSNTAAATSDIAHDTIDATDTVVQSSEDALNSDKMATEIKEEVESDIVAADAGAALYESKCKACHTTGLLNSPKYGDKAAWTARLSKDKETLYMHSIKGFNKMPAQAVDGVTEAQVKAAVDYMLASVS